jgi:ribosomal protein L31
MALGRVERILILAKTYPSPSAQFVETSCVAGVNESGAMRRLFPVPFRMIEDGQQFKKWQWIDVRVEKATKDHRPESHKIYVDTIACGNSIETKNEWSDRWAWLERMPSFDSFAAIDAARLADGLSLAVLRPKRLVALDIAKARHPDWTDEERDKLLAEQMQGNLFSEAEERKLVKQLRKVPFDFHYRYVCDTPEGEQEHKHKIVDWEAGALFWNCRQRYGAKWEAPFRAKLEGDLGNKTLMFLMGNQHRFQDQWLIVSLIYPPKQKRADDRQMRLL